MTAADPAQPEEDEPTLHEGLEHETIEDVQAEKALLAKAIGG